MAWASPTAPPPERVSAIRRHHASERLEPVDAAPAPARPEPISHGGQTPTTATATPATGHPVTAHTADPGRAARPAPATGRQPRHPGGPGERPPPAPSVREPQSVGRPGRRPPPPPPPTPTAQQRPDRVRQPGHRGQQRPRRHTSRGGDPRDHGGQPGQGGHRPIATAAVVAGRGGQLRDAVSWLGSPWGRRLAERGRPPGCGAGSPRSIPASSNGHRCCGAIRNTARGSPLPGVGGEDPVHRDLPGLVHVGHLGDLGDEPTLPGHPDPPDAADRGPVGRCPVRGGVVGQVAQVHDVVDALGGQAGDEGVRPAAAGGLDARR